MAETTIEPTTDDAQSQEAVEKAPNFVQRSVNAHPKTAKVVAITGAVTSAIGAVVLTRTLRSNKDHIDAAGDSFSEGFDHLEASVSPTDTES